ncbi:MAG: glutamate--tRNA ligase, partial [Methylobacteriaceae bacterium]
LAKVSEAGDWWRVVAGPVTPVLPDPAFIGAAAALLPAAPWDGETWKAWTNAVKAATGAKGKALFMPLRLAITGLEHGPDLAGLLPLIDRDAVARRLAGEG